MSKTQSNKLKDTFMNELIKLNEVEINNEIVQTVNARELYEFLESRQEFANWIKSRIADFGFIDDQDFLTILSKTPNGGRPSREYFITLDMAKELSMVERNDKGKQARRYFIECEKKLREIVQPQQAQPIGELEDKLRTIAFALSHSNISPIAKETALITSAETLTGISISYRPQIEQVTYSAKEIGDMLGISANRIGRIANAYGLKTEEYGLYYLNKSQHSDRQVENFRYFKNAVDKFKTILGDD